jgi:hypothetical protein
MLLAIISLLLLLLASAPHVLALKWAWDGEVNPGTTLARLVVGLPNLFIILWLVMMAFFAVAVEMEAIANPIPEKKAADAKPTASNTTGLTGSSAAVANYMNAAQKVGGRVLGVSN